MFALIAVITLSPQMAYCSFEPGRGVIRNVMPATPDYEAGTKPWFKSAEALIVNGETFARGGAPVKRLNVNFTAITYRDGVPILVKDAPRDEPDHVYVLISSRNCLFQPYVRVQRNP